jgi:aspartyl-tRNA(Asn)/glutamyl-tRNA(Gln) amidotransferase subunit C
VPLERKDVEEIALLARLSLSDEEVGALQRELAAILEYVAKLQRLDTRSVEPMTHAVPMSCPLREDREGESLPAEIALRAAPRRDDDYFEVPHILGGAKKGSRSDG